MSRLVFILWALPLAGIVGAAPAAAAQRPTLERAGARLTWSVRVNGRRLPTTELRALRGAAGADPRDYLVPVVDVARALAATDAGATLQVRGTELYSVFGVGTPSAGVPVDSLDNFRVARDRGAMAVDSLDNFYVAPRSRTELSDAPLTLQRSGLLSTNVQVIDGRAYIPISDVAAALGGTATVTEGAIEIRSPSTTCITCAIRPP